MRSKDEAVKNFITGIDIIEMTLWYWKNIVRQQIDPWNP
jgi:hypothetical protein